MSTFLGGHFIFVYIFLHIRYTKQIANLFKNRTWIHTSLIIFPDKNEFDLIHMCIIYHPSFLTKTLAKWQELFVSWPFPLYKIIINIDFPVYIYFIRCSPVRLSKIDWKIYVTQNTPIHVHVHHPYLMTFSWPTYKIIHQHTHTTGTSFIQFPLFSSIYFHTQSCQIYIVRSIHQYLILGAIHNCQCVYKSYTGSPGLTQICYFSTE